MIGRDIDASPVQYRTWIVDNQPDYAGVFYTGHKSGDHPFVGVIAYAIFDPNIVVDFNLPNALDWSTTRRVLPANITDSQLAIIDGYIYLFGGQNSAKIFRATLDDPTDWVDTGATLPTSLAASQLLVTDGQIDGYADGYIYLFGGATDATNASSTDTIFSAPRSNPLHWTNRGHLLPKKIHHSQLAVIDGYVYLFGGRENDKASDVILRSTVANPLAWTNTGQILIDPLFGSQLAILDGYVCLFGGMLGDQSSTDFIYAAPLSNPTNWLVQGLLPRKSCFGQFVAVGDKGYLITPTDGYASYTRILKCDINNPFSWVDTKRTIPGTVTQSQLAIIYDRLFLFGGNGSTIIFANNYFIKYQLYKADMLSYGFITRTEYNLTPTQSDLFRVLGFPFWKTDYGS